MKDKYYVGRTSKDIIESGMEIRTDVYHYDVADRCVLTLTTVITEGSLDEEVFVDDQHNRIVKFLNSGL